MKVTAEVRLKHGVLRRLAAEAGGAKSLARLLGIPVGTLYNWISMNSCPTPGSYGKSYTPEVEVKLEQLAKEPIEDIFPAELRKATKAIRNAPKVVAITKDIEPARLEQTAVAGYLSEPEQAFSDQSLKDDISSVLKSLTWREREIVRLRYGLGGTPPLTLEETAQVFTVTSERVRQVEAKAIRKLRQPHRSEHLESHLPESANHLQLEKWDKQREELAGKTLTEIYGGDE